MISHLILFALSLNGSLAKGTWLEKNQSWDASESEAGSAYAVHGPVWPQATGERQYSPYVQNLSIISGPKADLACPAFQGRIDVDLNKFAGGPFIYICYGKDDTIADARGPIRSVTVLAGANEIKAASTQGCTDMESPCSQFFVAAGAPSNGDMNQGVGGAFVYLAKNFGEASDEGDGLRLKDLVVVTGDSLTIPCPDPYTKIPVDLNEGARGARIFLCQLRGP